MSEELLISSTTDEGAIVQAAASNNESAARVPAPKLEMERLDGSTVVSFEHEHSERRMLAQRLLQHQKDLEELSGPVNETLTTNEPEESEEGQGDSESNNIDIAEVRRAATADAIEAARRQQQQRDEYYQQQQTQHLAQPQAEIQKLRAELMVPFQEKFKVLTADLDVKQLQEGLHIPLSEKLLDALLTLPGGVETAVHLMQNPQEVRKLSNLPEHMGLVHVAQLATRMNPAAHRRASNAPAPIRPIGGSATRSSGPIDETDYQTFKREREKQIKARRR